MSETLGNLPLERVPSRRRCLSPQADTRPPAHPAQRKRVITSAGLLACGSSLWLTFPDKGPVVSSTIARRLQLRGQPRNRRHAARHRIPFYPPLTRKNRSADGIASNCPHVKPPQDRRASARPMRAAAGGTLRAGRCGRVALRAGRSAGGSLCGGYFATMKRGSVVVRAKPAERVISDFPKMAVGIGEIAVPAAPIGALHRFDQRGTGPQRGIEQRCHLVLGGNIMR